MTPAYKLVAVDLDGTLFNDQRKIPEENIRAIRAAVAQGVHVMVATGRPYRSACRIFEQLGIAEGLALSQAGGLVSVYPSGETVYSRSHDPEFLRDLAEFCAQHGYFFHCMAVSDYYFLHKGPMADLTEHYLGHPGVEIPLEKMLKMHFGKATMVTPVEETLWASALLKAKFGSRVEIAVSDAGVTDITPRGVDKGVALLAAAEFLGIPREETMAMGDSENDIAMLVAAGLGVCMANGVPAAKEAADVIAPSNNDAGVAKILEEYVLN